MKCRTLVVHIVVKHIFKYINEHKLMVFYIHHMQSTTTSVGLCDVEWVWEANSCKKYYMLCLII